MRGLKYSFHVGDYIQFFVASLADAWIKMTVIRVNYPPPKGSGFLLNGSPD
ncbi:hypothetical protein JYQ79_09445 [Anaerobutyricum hallii]|uniref:hypothetical protein n=1 Tax=Anaerobutyricum hallii TaxID=39488 RepID=UPI001ADDD6A1|nr:hypothetical protein [Anaerobutyricum hallii]MBP0066998.1 hypothetical protein [Anaerobutyricum hallii]